MENQAPKRREKDDCFGSDRISQLPDVVLHHILCFLSQKEAVRTCVLSKSWRHLGLTRPVIDLRRTCDSFHARGTNFCENCFRGNDEAFIPVLEKTFQRYHHQNISAQVLRLDMLYFDSQSISVLQKWIPIFIKPNSCVTTFRLSIDESTHNWTRLDLPSQVFKAESLRNLCLYACKISSIGNVSLKNLQKLTLSRVYIDEQTLQQILSGCPFVEHAELRSCEGFNTISIASQNQHLKDFKLLGYYVRHIKLDAIEIDAPTLQSIHIQIRLTWKLNHNNRFPHLKFLYLRFVQLSTESFQNFSCNFPLLEDFALDCCCGFEEIKLFCPSLKRLAMDLDSSVKVDIDAPNIHCFEFSGGIFPTTISFRTASSEWKSQITVACNKFAYDSLTQILELNEMVKAVSQSQISLDVFEFMFYNSEQIECVINDPVAVELLNISRSPHLLDFNAIPCLFNALFQIFHPRYITAPNALRSPSYVDGLPGSPTGGVPQCIWEVLITERENKEYYWQQHLEEVSIEAYDYEEEVWQHVPGKCLPECAANDQMIRLELKWRD